MSKKVNISLNNKSIEISFNDVLKNHTVICEYVGLNIYQLSMSKISVQNTKNKPVSLTSTELRNINMHSLNKRSIRLINSFINLDKTNAYEKLEFIYIADYELKNVLRLIHITNKELTKKNFLAQFSLYYVNACLSYDKNITKILEQKTGYKQTYIKNLVKECFQNGYLKNSSQGLPGGILTTKTINYLKQSHLI